jgi:hypothetical protein
MSTHPVSSRWGLLALFAPLLAQAQAHPDAATPTPWAGVDIVDARPSSVRLLPQPGSDTLQIVFGQPRNCRLEARPAGGAAGPARYELTGSSGGRYCNQWYPGRMTLDPDTSPARLQLRSGVREASLPLWKAGQGQTADTLNAALDGRWTTTVQAADGDDVDLAVQLVGRDPGDTGGSLVYSSPRNCRLPLRFEGNAADGAWFAVLPGNGGAICDRLVGRWLVVQARGEGVAVRFDPANVECTPGCLLGRAAR